MPDVTTSGSPNPPNNNYTAHRPLRTLSNVSRDDARCSMIRLTLCRGRWGRLGRRAQKGECFYVSLMATCNVLCDGCRITRYATAGRGRDRAVTSSARALGADRGRPVAEGDKPWCRLPLGKCGAKRRVGGVPLALSAFCAAARPSPAASRPPLPEGEGVVMQVVRRRESLLRGSVTGASAPRSMLRRAFTGASPWRINATRNDSPVPQAQNVLHDVVVQNHDHQRRE
jgi:hypothetical protein